MKRAAFHVEIDGDRMTVRGTRAARWSSALESGVLVGLAIALAATLITLPDLARDIAGEQPVERVGGRAAVYVGLGGLVAITRAIVGGVRTDAWTVDGRRGRLTFGPDAEPVEVPATDITALRASSSRGRWRAEMELSDGSVWPIGATSRRRDEVEQVVGRARALLNVRA